MSQGLGISCNDFFNCNILRGVPITELFWVCLVASQIVGEGALVQMFSWCAREIWGSQFSLVACEDCLTVCFVELVVQRICVWLPCRSCHIYGIWTSTGNKVWGMLKTHQLGVAMQVTKGDFFHREGRFPLCCFVKLFCKSYWVYTAKEFTGYLFSLHYCFTCLRLAKPKVQLKMS